VAQNGAIGSLQQFGRVAPLGLNERLYLASNHCYTQPHAFPQS
jgi:hypothetical protein